MMSKFEEKSTCSGKFFAKFTNVVFSGEVRINKNTQEFNILSSFNTSLAKSKVLKELKETLDSCDFCSAPFCSLSLIANHDSVFYEITC